MKKKPLLKKKNFCKDKEFKIYIESGGLITLDLTNLNTSFIEILQGFGPSRKQKNYFLSHKKKNYCG